MSIAYVGVSNGLASTRGCSYKTINYRHFYYTQNRLEVNLYGESYWTCECRWASNVYVSLYGYYNELECTWRAWSGSGQRGFSVCLNFTTYWDCAHYLVCYYVDPWWPGHVRFDLWEWYKREWNNVSRGMKVDNVLGYIYLPPCVNINGFWYE